MCETAFGGIMLVTYFVLLLFQVLATIIIDFYDYQLYDLKVTIGSVLQFSRMDLVKEIIIVDDGSSLDYIIQVKK